MTDVKHYTKDEFLQLFRDWSLPGDGEASPEEEEELGRQLATFNRMLARGDGICVYENGDMSHPDLGAKRFASYGSPAAYFEPQYLDEDGLPPVLHPDTPEEILWRYQLVGVYKGDQL